MLALLFTAIFSTMSVIDDRHHGFLQAVLVAPVSRAALVLGKTLGGVAIALVQSVAFVALAPLAGFPPGRDRLAVRLRRADLDGAGLHGAGLRRRVVDRFHAGLSRIMSVALLPLWMLSGAMFPPGGKPSLGPGGHAGQSHDLRRVGRTSRPGWPRRGRCRWPERRLAGRRARRDGALFAVAAIGLPWVSAAVVHKIPKKLSFPQPFRVNSEPVGIDVTNLPNSKRRLLMRLKTRRTATIADLAADLGLSGEASASNSRRSSVSCGSSASIAPLGRAGPAARALQVDV